MISDIIKINIVETATNLAHARMVDEIGGNTNDVWSEEEDNLNIYTEEVQDLFNEYYDYYYSILEEGIVE